MDQQETLFLSSGLDILTNANCNFPRFRNTYNLVSLESTLDSGYERLFRVTLFICGLSSFLLTGDSVDKWLVQKFVWH